MIDVRGHAAHCLSDGQLFNNVIPFALFSLVHTSYDSEPVPLVVDL